MFGKNGIKTFANGQPILIRMVPRSFVEKIKALDVASLKAAVGPYLTDKEIAAVLKRRDLLLAEIEGMIKETGEAKVLY